VMNGRVGKLLAIQPGNGGDRALLRTIRVHC
jgi:hypothetical protein